MKIVEIPLDRLLPAPWSANVMSDSVFGKLEKSVTDYGLGENLVVRPIGDGYFEVISGNHRLKVMKKLGHSHAPCVVKDLDDAHARLFSQAMNHIEGIDDPSKKAELLKTALESISIEAVLELLPETKESINSLVSLGTKDLASHLNEWQKKQQARLKHFRVQLTASQAE